MSDDSFQTAENYRFIASFNDTELKLKDKNYELPSDYLALNPVDTKQWKNIPIPV